MNRDLFVINGIIIFYVIQRLSELLLSNSNESWLKENFQAVEVDPRESFKMKTFHSLWFFSLFIEANFKQTFQPLMLSLIIYVCLIICLTIRLHTIEKLKRFWTIKVYAIKNHLITTDGLYKYLRHPNYFVVVLEFLLIPLLFKAYFTMIIFSVLNLFVLKQRINLEEVVLMKQEKYIQHFKTKYRFLPFVFSLFILLVCPEIYGAEIKKSYKDYAESKSAEEYIRFASESKKLGFITSSFDGYAREFNIIYELDKNKLKELKLQIPVSGMDTDNGSRNEKMIIAIMEQNKYPKISGELVSPVELRDGEHETKMVFTIKDKKIERPVSYKVSTNNEGHVVSGHSTLKLSDAGLPDPSIAVAKVRDEFDINFSVKLK